MEIYIMQKVKEFKKQKSELPKFKRKYKPLRTDNIGKNNFIFSDEGSEGSFADAQPTNFVWTVTHECGQSYIYPGRWSFNRVGYMVTERPWTNENEVYYL
jgi:hypothetical protein